MFLTPEKKRGYYFILIDLNRQKEGLETEHSLIGKYHQQKWFQKTRFQNETELLERYHYLAHALYHIEDTIAEIQKDLDEDRYARICLEEDLKPFEKIDLRTMDLSQLSLFK